MKLEVRAVGGVERADIEFPKVALIVGETGAGKSSVADAARLVASNDWHVRDTKTKSSLPALVHTGYDVGKIRLTDGEAVALFQLPGCEYQVSGLRADGSPVYASPVATGIVNPLAHAPKERAQFFYEILGAVPTMEDIMRALEDEGLTRQQASQVYKRISEADFDTALAHYSTRVTEMRGKWEQVTGQRWGSKKGASYVPDVWSAEIEGSTEGKLDAAVAAKQKVLEDMIAASAVASVNYEDLQKKADRLEALKGQLFKLDQERAKAQLDVDKTERVLEGLPEPEKKPTTAECPHCGAVSRVDLSSGAVVLHADVTPVSDEENAKRTKARDDVSAALAKKRKLVAEMDDQCDACEKLVHEAEAAADKLGNTPPPGEHSTVKLEKAREEAADAVKALAAFRQYTAALTIHRGIELHAKVVEQLKPEGLRKRKLVTAVETFNQDVLGPLSDKMPGVRCYFDSGTLEPIMETRKGVRTYRVLSRGEKLVFQAVLQFGVAKKDKSALVVIDDADAVTGELREGLLMMALAADTPSIVCVAVRDAKVVPNLAKTGKGRTYVMRDKTAVEISELGDAK